MKGEGERQGEIIPAVKVLLSPQDFEDFSSLLVTKSLPSLLLLYRTKNMRFYPFSPPYLY